MFQNQLSMGLMQFPEAIPISFGVLCA